MQQYVNIYTILVNSSFVIQQVHCTVKMIYINPTGLGLGQYISLHLQILHYH